MKRFVLFVFLLSCSTTAKDPEQAQIFLEKYLANVPDKLHLVATNKTFVQQVFTSFESQHPRRNQSTAKHEIRFQSFHDTLQTIVDFNQTTNRTFTVGLNKFSDWTAAELEILRGNRQLPTDKRGSIITMSVLKSSTSQSNKQKSTTPATYDLTTRVSAVDSKTPILQPVKDQGQCGSCYAFALVALLEAQLAFQFGQTLNMTEQQIIDCSTGDDGCTGGYFTSSFAYYQSYDWYVDSRAAYPYKAVASNCSATKTNGWSANNLVYRQVTPNNVSAIQQALITFGPIWISLYVGSDCSGIPASSCPVKPQDAKKTMNTFQSYTGGIFQGTGCTTDPDNNNHAMAIVGYGYDSKTKLDYWKVRNSWGEGWGEDGYVRIRRGVNMCNVESDPFFIAKPAS